LIPTFGKQSLIMPTYCNGPKVGIKLLKISHFRMDDIHYSHIRVIYVSRPCVLGLALRSVHNIFALPNGTGGVDHYYSVEIMLDFSDRLN